MGSRKKQEEAVDETATEETQEPTSEEAAEADETVEEWDDPEFPTRWHYETHVENTMREIDGAKARLSEIEHADAATTRAELNQVVANAEAELKRLKKKAV